MQKINIGVIGAGYWGPNLVRNFSCCPETHVAVVCDPSARSRSKIEQAFPDIPVTADLEQVLSSSTVEAVAIATPVASHFPIARAALEAGKHVLVEKPLAGTVAEGETLVALANEKQLCLMCDHTFCYTGAVRKIKSYIDQNELGDLLYFDSVRVNLGLFQSDVNVLWDLCPHDLSILDLLLPGGLRPDAVAAQGVDAMKAGFESIAYLTLFFDSGLIAHVHANWLSPVKVRTILIGGTQRMVVWDDNNPAERVKIYDKGVDVSNVDRDTCLVNYRHGDAQIPVLDTTEALALVAASFSKAIRTGASPVTDGESGLRVLRVLEAADQSLREGGGRIKMRSAGAQERRGAEIRQSGERPDAHR